MHGVTRGHWKQHRSIQSVRQIKLTRVGFRAHVKIASRIVSYRIVYSFPAVALSFVPTAGARRSQINREKPRETGGAVLARGHDIVASLMEPRCRQ